MTEFRGGNIRQLGKALEQLEYPTAFLDRRGQIVYVNAALCAMVQADASELVGQRTTWELAKDDVPHPALLNALAPPAAARAGQVSLRQLTTPVVFGSTATGQAFVPLLDSDALPELTIVVFGDWEHLSKQVPRPFTASRDQEQVLAEVRGRWQQLDGLDALVGSSSVIQLALRRAQLAIQANAPYIVVGPQHVGKVSVSKAIYMGRLKRLGISAIAGQYFTIDCQLLEAPLVEGMLEVFAGRLRPGVERFAQQVVLERVDVLPEEALGGVLQWLANVDEQSTVSATSLEPIESLARRGPQWQVLSSTLGTCEISIPALTERCEDILPLAHAFVAQSCRKAERALLSIAPETQDLLVAFRWPENLQQLQRTMDEAVKLAVLTPTIKANHLPVEVRAFAGQAAAQGVAEQFEPVDLDEILLDIERVVLRRAMKLSPRNRAQVARWLSISRPRLLRRLEQLGLDDKKKNPGEEQEEA